MIPDDKKTIVDLRAMFSRSNMKRPPIRARDCCSRCLEQLLWHRDLARKVETSTRHIAAAGAIPNFKFCDSCSQIVGATSVNGINFAPGAGR